MTELVGQASFCSQVAVSHARSSRLPMAFFDVRVGGPDLPAMVRVGALMDLAAKSVTRDAHCLVDADPLPV